MKHLTQITRWIIFSFGLALLIFALPAAAQERNGQAERFERLERRVNEMAERQEQFMQRFAAQMERQRPVGQPGNLHPRPPGPPATMSPGGPAPKAAKGLQDLIRLLCLIGFICNILLAVWIFTDIRKRGEGSGIFIALALVAGIPAALIYSLTRIGDKKAQP